MPEVLTRRRRTHVDLLPQPAQDVAKPLRPSRMAGGLRSLPTAGEFFSRGYELTLETEARLDAISGLEL